MLIGFFARNFKVGSPGNGKGNPEDNTEESKKEGGAIGLIKFVPPTAAAAAVGNANGTGANHANGLSRLVQVGESASFSRFWFWLSASARLGRTLAEKGNSLPLDENSE